MSDLAEREAQEAKKVIQQQYVQKAAALMVLHEGIQRPVKNITIPTAMNVRARPYF